MFITLLAPLNLQDSEQAEGFVLFSAQSVPQVSYAEEDSEGLDVIVASRSTMFVPRSVLGIVGCLWLFQLSHLALVQGILLPKYFDAQ